MQHEQGSHRDPITEVEIAIIGAGFSGLGAAIRLRQAGFSDLLVFERSDTIGGTWRDNHYPGAACDIPSHLYSLSFAPNPHWTATYPSQPEIQRYLLNLVRDYELEAILRRNTEIKTLAYVEEQGRWRLQTNRGEVWAKHVWMCNGGLSRPRRPEIPGLERFAGPAFHSARWDHAVDLRGKRVAVIGTGASAIQFVPEVAKVAQRVDLYQRTPPWIIPRIEGPYSEQTKARFARSSRLRKLYRWWIYWKHEVRAAGMILRPEWMKLSEFVAKRHLRQSIKDPELVKKLTPNYTIGCKRILLSNDYYPALAQEHVHLITDAITEVEPRGVVAGEGELREVDVLIYGTGFYTTDNPLTLGIRGRGGKEVREYWKDGEKAYWGTMIPDFPNLFMIVGPNTGLGHNSQLFMIECQIEYALRLLQMAQKEQAATIEVRPEATAAFDEGLQKRMQKTVWKSGCQSWYLSKVDNQRVSALWPGWTFEFWAKTRRVDESAFVLRSEPEVVSSL